MAGGTLLSWSILELSIYKQEKNICKQKQPYVNLSLLFFSSSRYFSKLCSPKVSSSLCDLLQVDVCALQRKYNTSGNTENVTEDPDSPAKHASSVLNQIITIPDTPHLVLKIEIYDTSYT
jgi:hypothetical protein